VKAVLNVALVALQAVSLAVPVQAGNEDMNIFKHAGKKQTAADFEPAPDKIKTSFGALEFEGGAFPTEASVQKLYDEMDLQRANTNVKRKRSYRHDSESCA